MIPLSEVLSSNALISSALPAGLVAVFVEATSGLGEITLKKFAKYSRQPRAYFIGRSQSSADRIITECEVINPEGKFIFIKADVSLIRNVDQVCNEIKTKEKVFNLLFLTAGVPDLSRSETPEYIHLLAALVYYSRMRFTINLLPLIQHAPGLRRVVTVAGGSLEGCIDPTDFPALRVPFFRLRGHLTTLITLGLEAIARTSPEVSFIHYGPGTVRTQLANKETGLRGVLVRAYIYLLGRWVCVPIEESGERQLYVSISAKFPDSKGTNVAVQLSDGIEVARGTTGKMGSGVYSVAWDCESASNADFLGKLCAKELIDEVWLHTEGQFERITQGDRSVL